MKRIAIYGRRSIYSEESESINMQIEACKEYFKREECEFEVFIDEGFSGSNIDRPDFIRMSNKIHNNEFDIVVVYKIDRISRNMVDFINLVSDFEKYGVILISVTEGADPTTPAGKFVMNILASVAEMERSNTQQRVKDNMILLAKQGRWTGGNPPLGYKPIKTNLGGRKQTFLAVDESERTIVLDIYNKYIECESLNETTRYISEMHAPISISSITNILSSPVYVPSTTRTYEYLNSKGFAVFGEPSGSGYITYGKRPKIRNRKEWNTKGYIVAVSIHEALIDENIWFKTQKILEKNSIEPRPKQSSNSYLNTLVKCAQCGANMIIDLSYTRVDGTKIYSFRCGRKRKDASSCNNGLIMVNELEGSIETKLKNMGLNKKLLKEYVDTKEDKSYKKEIEVIRKKINKNNLQINNLTDKLSLLSNEASKSIISKIEQLTTDNKKLQTQLISLENIETSKKNAEKQIDDLYDNIQLFNNMDDATVEEKRKVIRTIIEKIDFDKEGNTAKITLKT